VREPAGFDHGAQKSTSALERLAPRLVTCRPSPSREPHPQQELMVRAEEPEVQVRASASPGATRKPSQPFPTISCAPPAVVAITGNPNRIASRLGDAQGLVGRRRLQLWPLVRWREQEPAVRRQAGDQSRVVQGAYPIAFRSGRDLPPGAHFTGYDTDTGYTGPSTRLKTGMCPPAGRLSLRHGLPATTTGEDGRLPSPPEAMGIRHTSLCYWKSTAI
jgi:hypothetical protein